MNNVIASLNLAGMDTIQAERAMRKAERELQQQGHGEFMTCTDKVIGKFKNGVCLEGAIVEFMKYYQYHGGNK